MDVLDWIRATGRFPIARVAAALGLSQRDAIRLIDDAVARTRRDMSARDVARGFSLWGPPIRPEAARLWRPEQTPATHGGTADVA